MQTQFFVWGNLTTPIRTYTNTYLSDFNYTNRHINNRLSTSTLTDGTKTITLASISYDETNHFSIAPVYEHDSACDFFVLRGDFRAPLRSPMNRHIRTCIA